MPKQFSGDGFSQEPLKGMEVARHREMFKTLDDTYIAISVETNMYMQSISVLIAAWIIFLRLCKFGGPLAVIAGAIAYYMKQTGKL